MEGLFWNRKNTKKTMVEKRIRRQGRLLILPTLVTGKTLVLLAKIGLSGKEVTWKRGGIDCRHVENLRWWWNLKGEGSEKKLEARILFLIAVRSKVSISFLEISQGKTS